MAFSKLETADNRNKFEDLSGVDITAHENPYDALIEACGNDPAQIQRFYSTHRTTRNTQQKAKLLDPDFTGLILDPILQKIENPTIEPGYVDPRNCLVFWARPPGHIRALVGKVQQKLLEQAPNLWLMPQERCHLTALEVTHSLTAAQIQSFVTALGSSTIDTMTDYTYSHRSRLIKPILSHDGAAVALSFLPAAGENLLSSGKERARDDDKYTYHHLRKDLFDLASSNGVTVDSRYVVPSSHITVARFLTQDDHETPEKMQAWITKIEEVNSWLEQEFWPKGESLNVGGEWIVGQEKGIDCRQGTLWYGGGQTIRLGKGF